MLLARALEEHRVKADAVLAIPLGGVLTGCEIANALKLPLSLALAVRLPVPQKLTAGFGAASESEVLLNHELVRVLRLGKEQVEEAVNEARKKIGEYKALPFENLELKGKTVILADDGLASGYTALAAVSEIKRRGAEKIILAVPTAWARGIKTLESSLDRIFCLNVREGYFFAVWRAYKKWGQISMKEARDMLEKFNRK